MIKFISFRVTARVGIGDSLILSAQQRVVFEAGFSGLTITSPVWMGRLLLNGVFFSKPLAAALRSGQVRYVK